MEICRLLPFYQLVMLCMCSSMANYLVIGLFTSFMYCKEQFAANILSSHFDIFLFSIQDLLMVV